MACHQMARSQQNPPFPGKPACGQCHKSGCPERVKQDIKYSLTGQMDTFWCAPSIHAGNVLVSRFYEQWAVIYHFVVVLVVTTEHLLMLPEQCAAQFTEHSVECLVWSTRCAHKRSQQIVARSLCTCARPNWLGQSGWFQCPVINWIRWPPWEVHKFTSFVTFWDWPDSYRAEKVQKNSKWKLDSEVHGEEEESINGTNNGHLDTNIMSSTRILELPIVLANNNDNGDNQS